jgi:serine/threonine protein kinase
MSAENLVGLTTDCGWEIFEKITSKMYSGGTFCVRYLARDATGKRAFVKAMDFSRAFKEKDRIKALNDLTTEYQFETAILNLCKDKNMTKVVFPLSSGTLFLNDQVPPLDQIYFIVFEKAESDLRQAFINTPPNAWYNFFRAIKHVCIGLEQLHRARIAHLDIKPSNILNFKNDVSKVADLGRVIDEAGTSPFATSYFSGDPRYAPIEYLFQVPVINFQERYLADLYGVGSLIYQTFMNVQITAALLADALRITPNLKAMPFHVALPIFETVFYTLMDRLQQECKHRFDDQVAASIVSIVTEMCHPNNQRRGNPKAKSLGTRVSFRRYSNKADSILRQLKIGGYL